ncbi:RecD/TraA family helicase [Lachnospiraceae bacterium M18-1]|nr:RecD/TraA family helicase [Lachnospiraceae bacterium M18-1]
MRCRYVNKIFLNEEDGFTIASYSTRDTSIPLAARNKYLAKRNIIGFTAVGYNLPLTDQIELEMEGNWENGSHGMQFRVESFLEIVPRTKAGIIGYLSSGAIRGVRQKMAEAIYQKFGLETLEVIENSPEKLLSIKGISEQKLKAIVESYGQNKEFRELMTFLAPYHVTANKVNMILKTFKEESVRIIQNRPYMLCAVKGFGFLTVDSIGRQLCRALNDPMRISGCVSYLLNEAMKEGHLYLEQETLIDKTLGILNKDLTVPAVVPNDISSVLYQLVLQQSIVIDGDKIYIFEQYEEERLTAGMVAKRLQTPRQQVSIEDELRQAQQELGITLSERQEQAVKMVFESSISIITGGPGTGKTTVLKVILFIYGLKYRTTVQLMAPTGRAARRMAESTGDEEASTMHMALGLLAGTDFELEFQYLESEFLNVDEVSMVDMHLAYEFFRRVKSNAKILLLGDVDQLPSVGAGDVFRQLIGCGLIPVTILDMVYRQGLASNIPVNAKMIQKNQTNLNIGEDFVFLPCEGAEQTAEMVKKLYLEETARNGIEQVQILTPYRVKTAAGVNELNRTLEDMVNPPASDKKQLTVGRDIFRAGDKVLQNKNIVSVSNGDMGIIQDIFEDEEGNEKVRILFSENREIEYEKEQMEMVEHANAITVHKSQGSEYPVVIIPCVKAFYTMLKRNILYTAITRAKRKVYLVGEWNAVCQAIHTDDSGKRNTMLGKRIQDYYYEERRRKNGKAEQLKLAV